MTLIEAYCGQKRGAKTQRRYIWLHAVGEALKFIGVRRISGDEAGKIRMQEVGRDPASIAFRLTDPGWAFEQEDGCWIGVMGFAPAGPGGNAVEREKYAVKKLSGKTGRNKKLTYDPTEEVVKKLGSIAVRILLTRTSPTLAAQMVDPLRQLGCPEYVLNNLLRYHQLEYGHTREAYLAKPTVGELTDMQLEFKASLLAAIDTPELQRAYVQLELK